MFLFQPVSIVNAMALKNSCTDHCYHYQYHYFKPQGSQLQHFNTRRTGQLVLQTAWKTFFSVLCLLSLLLNPSRNLKGLF